MQKDAFKAGSVDRNRKLGLVFSVELNLQGGTESCANST